MALKIVMFSDFVCPFCYIGFEVMRKLKKEFDLEIEWRGFQIHPEWPAEGIPIEKVRGLGDMEARQQAWKRISAMAETEGLPISPPSAFTNSRAALAACEYAREQGKDEDFETRIFRAYFVEGANIGDPELIVRLSAESGLDPAAVADAIKSPQYEMKLKNNALAANQRQVSGVPTFFIGEFSLVGAQSTDVCRQILRRVSERIGASA
jgi:predicted DsbA family dithiol-disulfide isomerase